MKKGFTLAIEVSEAALIEQASDNGSVLVKLFEFYRPRLWRLVAFRMDSRLQGRIDPDDVLQEAWLDVASRAEHFARERTGSPFIWFRMVVTQTLIDLHRRHLESQKRDASRERTLCSGWSSSSTSLSLTEHFLGDLTSPSQMLLRAELSSQLDAALRTLSELDQEVLALRHLEELSNSEAAEVLHLSEQAASVRYIRALTRLRHILQKLPAFAEFAGAGAAS